MYGGFAGDEEESVITDHLDDRNLDAHETILNGDFKGDDTLSPLFGKNSDNASHVVIAAGSFTAETRLDGFTISEGYAQNGFYVNTLNIPKYGGGLYIIDNNSSSSLLTLTNLTVTHNQADYGGGIYSTALNAGVKLTNVAVTNNRASAGEKDESWGGGIYHNRGTLEIINSSIINNKQFSSDSSGGCGGIYSVGAATLTNVVIAGNEDLPCLFGGMYAQGGATLTNVAITGNRSKENSGIYIESGGATLTNTTIAGNYATENGSNAGIAIANNGGTVYVNNSIIWGNDNKDRTTNKNVLVGAGNASIVYSHTLLEGGTQGENTIVSTDNPLFREFVTATTAETSAGDFSLTPCSPAIDLGDNTTYSAIRSLSNDFTNEKDLAGNPRLKSGTIDLGAYEVPAAPLRAVWTGTVNNDWNNPGNWNTYYPTAHTDPAPPYSYTDVYISGKDVAYYPILADADNKCDNIYFMQGGEIGNQHFLTYSKAHVQLNLGLGGSAQLTENDLANVTSTTAHLKYSAAKSTPLNRDRWYMLSPALQDMVSGDFAFGDYPRVYMQKFNNIPSATLPGETVVGQWTKSFANQAEPLNPMEGFAVLVKGYANTYGQQESGIGDSKYGTETPYGLKEVNGILELPFYEDNVMSKARRIHQQAGDVSKFYYLMGETIDTETGTDGDPDLYTRNVNGNPYKLVDGEAVTYSVAGMEDGQTILIGNPFMSTIDFVEFLGDNDGVIEPHFKLWTGTKFATSTVSGETVTTVEGDADIDPIRYIAPMQSFLVTLKEDRGDDNSLTFDATTIQAPTHKTPLRSSSNGVSVEKDIIRIKATNSAHSAETLIGQRANADNGYVSSEDVYKLFSPVLDVPEIFTVADRYKLAMNFISNDSEQTIPIGLKCDLLGQTILTLTGMSNYAAEKIEFIDGNKIIDITGQESFEYTEFDHQKKGLEEDRFFLRIQHASTGIKVPEVSGIQVYETAAGINVLSATNNPIRQIDIYNVNGQKLYGNTTINSSLYTIENRWSERILIVRVVTAQGVKNVKIIKT
jgi:hypothetical protein